MTDDELQKLLDNIHNPIYIAKHDNAKMAMLFTGRRTLRAIRYKVAKLAKDTCVGRTGFIVADSKIFVIHKVEVK